MSKRILITLLLSLLFGCGSGPNQPEPGTLIGVITFIDTDDAYGCGLSGPAIRFEDSSGAYSLELPLNKYYDAVDLLQQNTVITYEQSHSGNPCTLGLRIKEIRGLQ